MWNVMVHAQKPDLVFRWNGRVSLNWRGRQFSWLLAAEVCASAVVMLDAPRSEVAWEYWLPPPFASFPFTSPPVHHRVPSGFNWTLFIFKKTAYYFLPTFKFSVSDLWRAKQSHDKNVVVNVSCNCVSSDNWHTKWWQTNWQHSSQTDPPFHSRMLQTQCLTLPYMSQNFFSEHMKAKSTILYCCHDRKIALHWLLA
jgi:hypothetical protein